VYGGDVPLVERRFALAAVAAAVLLSVLFEGVRHDDAYITYRYAENLARGNGPVFNPGERVLGTTAPGHMLLGALLYPVVGKAALPSMMAMLGCLGWVLQALAAFAILAAAFSYPVAAFGGAAVLAGMAGSSGVVALETNLVAACALWSLALAIRSRWLGAFVWAALAGLFRPDAYLVTLLVAVACLVETRRIPWRAAAAWCAITLPWQLFALLYYGSVLPRPAVVKHARNPFGDYLVHELGHPVETLFGSGGAAALAAAWLLFAAGACALRARGRRLWLVPAYGALHFLAYAWLRPFRSHTWHLYPLCVVAALLSIASLGWAAERVRSSAARSGFAVTGGLVVALYAWRTAGETQGYRTAYWGGARDAVYRAAADFLAQHARADDLVGALEVGTIGYDSERPMYDWGGLVTVDPIPSWPAVPRLRWIVVDPLYEDWAWGLIPVRRFRSAGFTASVYSIEWMKSAVQTVMKRHGERSPSAALNAYRGEVAEELQRLASTAPTHE